MAGSTGAELAQASQATTTKRPIAANVVSWVASKLIRRSTRAVAGLDIDIGARSNADVLMGNLPKVKVRARICFCFSPFSHMPYTSVNQAYFTC
jgi:hypothetical protein